MFNNKNIKFSHRFLNTQRGMTLIEIMIVVVILGILGAIVVPNLLDRPDEARVQKAKQDIRAFEAALSLYKLDNFNYPDTSQGLQALQGKYIERISKDPWGNDYQYVSPGSTGAFDVYSLGADGQSGGEGVNADIGNQ
jgi:general secretion pathway protein G